MRDLYEWLEGVRVAVSLVFLSYASWQDYKSREVSNMVWAILAPLGLTLTLMHILLTNRPHLLTVLVLSFLFFTGMTFAFFYLGFFGGADVKAFICLSLALPYEPAVSRPYLGAVSPIYCLSIFGNAVLASALTAVGLLFHNVLWHIRSGERLFEGVDHEPAYKKMLLLFTGYRVDVSELREKPHLVPLEELSKGENGRILHSLSLFVRTDVDREASVIGIEDLAGENLSRIWVTPYLPYIVYITVGLVVALSVGDILFWLITRMLGFV